MLKKLYRIWLVLLILSGACAAGFLGHALLGLWGFAVLKAETRATISRFEVVSLPSSRFGIEAYYSYSVDNTAYQGKTLFESPEFLNRLAAENYHLFLWQKTWKASYDPSSPSKSTIDRRFPYKKCWQALLTLGVFLYFYFSRSLLEKYITSIK